MNEYKKNRSDKTGKSKSNQAKHAIEYLDNRPTNNQPIQLQLRRGAFRPSGINLGFMDRFHSLVQGGAPIRGTGGTTGGGITGGGTTGGTIAGGTPTAGGTAMATPGRLVTPVVVPQSNSMAAPKTPLEAHHIREFIKLSQIGEKQKQEGGHVNVTFRDYERITSQLPSINPYGQMSLRPQGGSDDVGAHQGHPTGGFLGSTNVGHRSPGILNAQGEFNGVLSDGKNIFLLAITWSGHALSVAELKDPEKRASLDMEEEFVATEILADSVKTVKKIYLTHLSGIQDLTYGKNISKNEEDVTEQWKAAVSTEGVRTENDVLAVLKWVKGA